MTEENSKGEFPSVKDQFEPGQSGNPAGRKVGSKNRSTILAKYLGVTFKDKDGKMLPQPFGQDGEPLTVEEAIEVALLVEAINGNVTAIKEIKDTVHGKISQPIGQDPDNPFPVTLAPLEVVVRVIRKSDIESDATGLNEAPANNPGKV